MNFWFVDNGVQIFTAKSVGTDKSITIRGREGSGMIRFLSYWEDGYVFSMVPPIISSSKDLHLSMHMYTIVRSDGNIKMYFNGKETDPMWGTDGVSDVTFAEIASGDSVGIYFENGFMDEFSFYDRALSADEISEMTNGVVAAQINSKSYKDNKLTVNVTLNTFLQKYPVCIPAAYDENGKLTATAIYKMTNNFFTGSLQMDCPEEPAYIKLFIWDSATGMVPQREYVQYNIQ